MSNETFNPEVFLNVQTTEANSTELTLVPEGEYMAMTEPVTPESFRTFDIKRGDRAGQKGVALDVQFVINDDSGSLKELLGRAPKVKYGMMLDVRPDGTLEMGKGRNVGLGRLREAFGQNLTGRPWAFGQLGGQVAKIKVKHRIDNGKTYAEVAEVTRA